MDYSKHYGTKKTSQSEPIPGKDQVENSAGGYSFKVSDFDRLMRFLILGSEGGSYYANERTLTQENAKSVVEFIQSTTRNGLAAVSTIVEVSQQGRAAKNDPAIYALALCATFGDWEVKHAAYAAIPKVCRIGTHLFSFCQAIQNLRGWSRGLRNGVAKYYTEKNTDRVAVDVLKYRQRNGWTHQDVLRLSHPKAVNSEMNEIFKYVVGKSESAENPLIQAFQEIQGIMGTSKNDVNTAVGLIREFKMPREFVPTQLLNSVEVWEALLEDMPMTALVRNLGKMTSVGLFDSNLSPNVKLAVEKLTDSEAIKKSRIHPLTILQGLTTYSSGMGFRGSLSWSPVKKITDALDKAFYKAFGNVESTGKNYLLAVDCSGSMGSEIAGTNMSCRLAAAAMSLVTANVEENVEIVGFSHGSGSRWSSGGIAPIQISAESSLKEVENEMARFPWGGTDCALPMLYALKKNLFVDTFVIYTDSETWAGDVHPTQALERYRKEVNPNAKLITVGMVSNGFTIADPNDAGMLDVVGFDTATPQLITEFSKGFVNGS